MAKSQKRTSKVVENGVASRVAKDESSQGPLRNSAGKNEDGKSKEEKSKAELRAERRAKQEAQRAAKAAEKQPKTAKKDESAKENKKPLSSTNTGRKEGAVLVAKEKKSDPAMNSLRLFSHLHYKTKPTVMLATSNIHPAIVELGVKYASRVVFGSNARCVALLQAVKQLINDYTTPREKDFGRGLETQLGLCTSYLNASRPMSVSMTNALRHLKTHLTQLPNNIQDNEARAKLCDVIDTYIKDQIEVAGVAICRSVKKKIANGDVILIYACSSLLYQILVESHRADTKFSVVVVDSAPWFEGREMVRRLVSKGLRCTYVLINSISFIMRQVTKVLVGAHALLANGYVMSRAGCSLVALVAHAYNVPVLVCCETYKFCERVQTDAFVFNELGTVEDMAPPGSLLSQHLALPCLSPLSILYDVTPPDLVTAVVTEVAILPCTSVPVILRIGLSDIPS
ncbi:hypothetical protein AAG570_002717 [Ranatra chinensis]|uniref:Translation initiation factor eIF2B subunit delta n=1 Tax=Ranatra chinensis TaxID=642074 RepID=A0ABD0Y8G7_9HEMI